MNEAFIELYEDYLLKCEPHSTPDGRYLANLVISFAQRGGQNDVSITPDYPSFAQRVKRPPARLPLVSAGSRAMGSVADCRSSCLSYEWILPA